MSESGLHCCLSISSVAAFYFPPFYTLDSKSASPILSPHIGRATFNANIGDNGIYLHNLQSGSSPWACP